MAATKMVEFVDRKEFIVMAPPDKSFLLIILSSRKIILPLYLLITLLTL